MPLLKFCHTFCRTPRRWTTQSGKFRRTLPSDSRLSSARFRFHGAQRLLGAAIDLEAFGIFGLVMGRHRPPHVGLIPTDGSSVLQGASTADRVVHVLAFRIGLKRRRAIQRRKSKGARTCENKYRATIHIDSPAY